MKTTTYKKQFVIQTPSQASPLEAQACMNCVFHATILVANALFTRM